MMRKKARKKSKKKSIKKRKTKAYGKKKDHKVSVGLRKVGAFKFQTLGKIYKNFTEKRKRYKIRHEKLKSKNREKQIKEEKSD